MSFRIEEAYRYYADHILAPLEAKLPTYAERGIPSEGLVPFRDWEVFAAILADDRGSVSRSGADLAHHEVKSAKRGGGFEYQYHRRAGVSKLDHDLTIEHLFVVYENNYRCVDVYALGPEQFAEAASVWREQLIAAYQNPRNQRFRRSVHYRKVVEEGRLVMRIRDGRIEESGEGKSPTLR